MKNNMKLQLDNLFSEFDKLQKKFGDKKLDSVYGCGEVKRPEICFVFMNPTAKNVATDKKWQGIKAPWIGTKNIWKMFFQLGFLDDKIFDEIKNKIPKDWDYGFAEKVYKEIKNKKAYITNLSKATKTTAENPKNSEFREYLKLFEEEISYLKPKIIITFGNQVSSIVLGANIKVGENRKKVFEYKIKNKTFKVFPLYYPVGQGQRNIGKTKSDLKWILKKYINADL